MIRLQLKGIVTSALMLSAVCIIHAQTWHGNVNEQPVLNGAPSSEIGDPHEWNFYEVQQNFDAYWKNKTPQKGQGYNVYRRWAAYMEPRVYPSGFAPDLDAAEASFKEFKENSDLPAPGEEAPGAAQSANWQLVGPVGNPSTLASWYPDQNWGQGRVNCITFHPSNTNIIWIGTPAGGLWKSTDAGNSWTLNSSFLESNGVSSIAISATNPDIMYLASGDADEGHYAPSRGVFKSTDGGATWQTTGFTRNLSDQTRIYKILVSPTDANRVIIATAGGGAQLSGLWHSTDGGVNWDRSLWGGGFYGCGFYDLEFKPGDPSVVYAAQYGCSPSAIYKSTDGGISFPTEIALNSNVSRVALAVTPDNPNLVYALCVNRSDRGFYGLYKSTNSGSSFSLASSSPNILGSSVDGSGSGGQGTYDLAIAVSPTDENEVVVGGVNQWKSTNGGSSWSLMSYWNTYSNGGAPVVHADVHALEYASSGTIYSGNDGGLHKSTDAGASWSHVVDGFSNMLFERVSVTEQDENLIIVGSQDNSSFKRDESGWYGIGNTGDGHDNMIDHQDKNIIYTATQNGRLSKSTDGGLTYDMDIGPRSDGAWITPYKMDYQDSKVIYAGYHQVYKSIDGAATWTSISGSLAGGDDFICLGIDNTGDIIYAGTGTRLFMTSNGGSSWTEITSGLPVASAMISNIEVSRSNGNTAWVTFDGYADGEKVYKTTNGGSSWTNISGTLPNVPMHCIRLDVNSTDETLFLGSDYGVFTITNTIDWTIFQTGMPDIPVKDLEIQYGAGKLIAATRGRGLWSTDINTTPNAPSTGDCSKLKYRHPTIFATPFSGDNGNLVGHNTWAPTEFAEYNDKESSFSHVMGVDFQIHTADATNPNTATFTVKMWAADGPSGAPGTVLATKTVNYSDLNASATTGLLTNEILFDNPVAVNAGFYTGFEIDYTTGNKIVVYNSGSGQDENTLWLGTNGVWEDSPTWWNSATRKYSASIYPMVGNVPSTDFTVNTTSGGAGISLSFTNQSSGSQGSSWTFEGGTPSTSYELNPQVSYSSPGTYDVKLVSYGTCFAKDSLTKSDYITIGAPTLSAQATDVSCNGGNDGSIDLDPGQGSFTFLWSNGATTEDISGLTAGNYTCTVTSGGSNSEITVTVSEPDPINLSTNESNPTCNGGSNGNISLTVSGGTAPYTYVWSNGATTEDISNLTAGSYSVTVTAQGGCNANTSVNITQPSPLNLTIAGTTDATCGSSNGAIDLEVSGGTPGYTYVWSSGSTQQDPTGLAAGSYSVTVTDAEGCTANKTANVVQPSALDVNVASTTDVGCNGGNDGSIDITVAGGSAPYSFSWSNGATTEDVSGLTAGNYAVTVTDASSCSFNANASISEPTALSVSVTDETDVACNGNTNGAITIAVTGGSTPYSYNWSNGATTKNISSLGAGSYTVTVTDDEGCEANAQGQVNEPSPLTTSVKTVDMTSCAGGDDGAIDINVNGGSTPYTYAWSNGATTQDVSGLDPGVYNVTITDKNGCSSVENANVGQPAALVGTIASVSNPTCVLGNDGSIDLEVSGGTPGYSYNWSNGSTSQDPSGLSRGGHSVTITDANGCTNVTVGNLSDPDSLLVDVVSQTNVSCSGGNDGSAQISVTGGIEPYAFLWSNGATVQNPSNLTAGSYTVTVSGPAGCETQANLTITEPSGIAVSLNDKSDVSCNGGNDGAIDINVSGGTAPYSFAWSNGATSEDVSGLNAGSYSVTVSGAGGGCSVAFNASLSQPSTVAISVENITDATCGSSNGAVDIEVSGGSAPYTYLWSSGATTQDLSGANAGNYTVTVTDDNGCTAQAQAEVDQPSALNVQITSVTDVTCHGGNDGEINITVSGGSGTPSFVWNHGPNTEDVADLAAGTYEVTVTDQALCSFAISATVGQPGELVGTILSQQDVSCAGGSDGSVDLRVTGGVAPYSYAWNGGSNLQDPTGLSQGLAEVTITDANLCQDMTSTTISEPAPIAIGINDQTNASCHGGSNGALDLAISGGSAPYTFTWSNGETTEDISGLAAGNYAVTVTDNIGCTGNQGFVITQPTAVNVAVTNIIDASCNTDGGGSIEIEVTGGTSPYTFLWSNGVTVQNAVNLGSGTYSVTATDDNGCTGMAQGTVTKPVGANVEITNVKDVSCNGGNDGSINITVSGGLAPYTYNWGGGVTTQDRSNLSVGQYTVTVESGGGCSQSTVINISEPGPLTIVPASQEEILCNGDATGALNVDATGGSAPYAYSWSNGGTTKMIEDLPAGQYIVTVEDVKNCTQADTFNLTEPTALVASIVGQNNVNCGGSDGDINADVTGGVGPYTYAWSSGETTEDINGLAAGSYTLTATDANGCSDEASTVITQPSTLSATIDVVEIACNGGQNGEIDITPQGGTAPYTFTWAHGPTTEDLSGLSAGNYQVSISDDGGCTFNTSANLLDPTAITANTSDAQDASCSGGNDGTINLEVSGGTPPYTFAWSNGETTEDIMDLVAGSYSVNISDQNGCSSSGSASIAEPTALSASILGQVNVACHGDNNGSVNLEVSGGTPPYSFSWTNGANTEDQQGLTAGTYNVTVTDAGGCTTNAGTAITQPVALALSVKKVVDVACNGGNNGSVDIQVSGGTTPYTYAWSSGQTTQDLTGVAAGQYDVTVTDAKGCSNQISANVQESGSLLASVDDVTHVSCFDGNDGAVDVSVSGGTAPYSFSWTGGATTEDLSGLSAGNYQLDITDSLGCVVTLMADIMQPDSISITTVSMTDVSCNGGSDGSASVQVSGGTAPYDFAWSSGGNSATVFGLTPGSHTVTVTDVNGCMNDLMGMVAEPTPVTITVGTIVDNSSCGVADGSINVSASGGTSPYTYGWSDGSTSQNISGVSAGVYSVVATDANGCEATAEATVNQPGTLTALLDSVTDVSCNSNEDGAAYITVTGGSSPYNYSWTSGETTEDIMNKGAGTYTVTISDQGSCELNIAVTIAQPAPLSLTAQPTEPNCNGGTDGALDLVVSGGTAPFTYSWSTGATAEDLSNLASGDYSVEVWDDNGCMASLTTLLNEPGAFSVAIINVVDASCAGASDGSINIAVNGGVQPYTYAWSNGSTDEDPTGLVAISYNVNVTDAEGCVANANTTVGEPTAIVITDAVTDVSVNGGSDGVIDLGVSGGTAPYAFNWSTGETTEDIGGLIAGDYGVRVTDSKLCTDSTVITVNQPSAASFCSGLTTLSSAMGSFEDGSSSVLYATNTDCMWLIDPANTQYIILDFESFATELNEDWVTIYDGADTTAPIINQFSGINLPVPTVSSGGVMLVRFTSNNAVNDSGWVANYEAIPIPTGFCSGTDTLTASSGIFSDGSDASDYNENSSCSWLIQPAGATSVTVGFTSMDTENGFDWVRVYDGNDAFAPLLGEFTGNEIDSITTSGGSAFVQFTSDFSVNSGGWDAYYNSSTEANNFCMGTDTLTGTAGSFGDGSGASNYGPNSACEWLIQPPGVATITLTFSNFETEYLYDYVEVYDGDNAGASLIGYITGDSLPDPITSSGGAMFVRFITNNTVQEAGWFANYTTTDPVQGAYCSGTTNLTSASGSFADGSGPTEDYVENSNCSYLIQPAGATSITLTFSEFDTEIGYDFVTIYDGTDNTGPVLAQYSGSGVPAPVTVIGGSMFVEFTSDGLINAGGWVADYTSSTGSPSYCLGTVTLTAQSGSFNDGSGPSDYLENSDCYWLIQPPLADSIGLQFTEMDLEVGGDSVWVFDGDNVGAPLLGAYSSSTIPTEILVSSGGSMLVYFSSNGATQLGGWSANFEAAISSAVSCHGQTDLTDPSGVFSDGSGSDDYAENSDCSWLINPGTGNFIELTFTEVDLENGYDYVRVYDGSDENAPLLAVITGDAIPNPITTTGSQMFVHFESDYAVNKGGWTAMYDTTSVGGTGGPCSGLDVHTALSDTIHDGSGPGNYLNNSDCQWLLQPAGATTVRLVFTEFDTESGFDFVTVYDGEDTNAAVLGSFSGSSLPPYIYSTGGSMYVRFTSDNLFDAGGFVAYYDTTSSGGGGSQLTPCDGFTMLVAQTDTLSDGSGPGMNYADNSWCEWLIEPVGADSITLSFLELDLESGWDFVYVFDGADTTAPIIGAYSGNSLPDDVTSSGGSMFVVFYSDFGTNAAGWSAVYNAHNNGGCTLAAVASGTDATCEGCADGEASVAIFGEVGTPVISWSTGGDGLVESDLLEGWYYVSVTDDDFCFAEDSVYIGEPVAGPCAGLAVLTAASGQISDGSGSESYANDSDCEWLIQPGGIQSITLVFLEFSTEEGYDSVVVYDGPDQFSPILGVFTGSSLPSAVTSSGGAMFITFHSDGTINDDGFLADYSTIVGANTYIPEAPEVVIAPNPAVGEFNFHVALKGGSAEYSAVLYDALGVEVWNDPGMAVVGDISKVVDVHDLPSGMYNLTLHIDHVSYVYKVVIQQ